VSVTIPDAGVAAIVEETAAFGVRELETGGFLLVPRERSVEAAAVVSTVAFAGDVGIVRHRDVFQISERALDRIFTFADDRGLWIPAQFHSHEVGAFLSFTDKRHGLCVEEFTSIVIPTFAAPPEDTGRWGWWRFMTGRWREAEPGPVIRGTVQLVRFDEAGSMTLEHSRSLLLAANATGMAQSALERRLEASTVVVSFDPSLPLAGLTARVVLTTLRRGLGGLALERDDLPDAEVERLEEAVRAIDPDRPLMVVGRVSTERVVRLHVGPSASSGVIRVVPEGYGAHVATMSSAVIRPARGANALGAIYAGALGAAEVFKHTASVLPTRRIIHRHLRFCPVTLGPDLGCAPDLPSSITLVLSLIGVGAIGTGITLILSELPADGALLAVDRQQFDRENRGTYSLGTAADVIARPNKIELAARVLRRFDVREFPHPLSQLLAEIDAGTEPWNPLVLTALDSPEARREAQRLWPNRLIDAATGDTMAGLHDHRFGGDPCMMCLFPERYDMPSGADRIAERLGIRAEILADGERPLEEADLAGLTQEQRHRLEPELGKPICGLVRALGLTTLDAEGYMPSVPFISLQAACLSVGRLLAREIGVEANGNFVQYDGLIGPQNASVLWMERNPACYCSTHARTIATVRGRRAERDLVGQERRVSAPGGPRSR
jgi:hypothetical protein